MHCLLAHADAAVHMHDDTRLAFVVVLVVVAVAAATLAYGVALFTSKK